MPTTIAVVRTGANAREPWDDALALAKSADLVAVAVIAAIGLLAVIGLTLLLPLSEGSAALFAATT